MKTTLKDLMQKPLGWNPYLEVWIDPQGIIYELKDKDIADTIEFEMIDGSEYELAAAVRIRREAVGAKIYTLKE